MQAKLKHLRGLAQEEGGITILAGNADDADEVGGVEEGGVEAAEVSSALEE